MLDDSLCALDARRMLVLKCASNPLIKKHGEFDYLLLALHALNDSLCPSPMAHTSMGGSPREHGGHATTTVREHLEPPHLHATTLATEQDDHGNHRCGEVVVVSVLIVVLVPVELPLNRALPDSVG